MGKWNWENGWEALDESESRSERVENICGGHLLAVGSKTSWWWGLIVIGGDYTQWETFEEGPHSSLGQFHDKELVNEMYNAAK